MPQTGIFLTCANCTRDVPEVEAKDAGWRYWSTGLGELVVFCGVCAYREFRLEAPTSTDIPGEGWRDVDPCPAAPKASAAAAQSGLVGRVYLERGQPVTVLVRWGSGGGPRNVLILRADGARIVRPLRGLKRPLFSDEPRQEP